MDAADISPGSQPVSSHDFEAFHEEINLLMSWGITPFSAALRTLRSVRFNHLVVERNHRDELDGLEERLIQLQRKLQQLN